MSGFTTLSATVLDPNGIPYANGTWTANFVDPGTPGKTPLINGSIITRVYAGDLDSFGNFIVSLPDNNIIATQTGCLGTQWMFSFSAKSAPVGLGAPPAFSTAGITITGVTQNITSTVQAAAASLQSLQGTASVTSLNGVIFAAPQTDAGIQAAINACAAGGSVFLPAGTYTCKNNLPITITKAINLIGAGWGANLQMDSSVGASTPLIRFVPSGAAIGATFQNFQCSVSSGTPGSYAIQVDTTGANEAYKLTMLHLNIGPGFGSGGIWLNNGSSPNANGGVFDSVIEDSYIFGGILATNVGDSVDIFKNILTDNATTSSIGVNASFIAGASSMRIHDNVISCNGAGVHLGANATVCQIFGNEFETLLSTDAGSNGAYVDIDGTMSNPCSAIDVYKNSFQIVNSSTLNCLRINWANVTNVRDNFMERGVGAHSIVVTANATNTRIRSNNFNGDTIANAISDAAPVSQTLYEIGAYSRSDAPVGAFRDNTNSTWIYGYNGVQPMLQGVNGANYIFDGTSGAISGAFSAVSPAATVTGFAKFANVVGSTLTGASSGNNVTLLNYQTAKAAITGNAADQALYTYTLPANTVATGKGIRVTCGFTHTSGTASVTYKVKVNGVNLYGPSSSSTAGAFIETILMAASSTTVDVTKGALLNGAVVANASSTSTSTAGLAWTSSQIVEVDFNVANTDQVTPGSFIVELIQ